MPPNRRLFRNQIQVVRAKGSAEDCPMAEQLLVRDVCCKCQRRDQSGDADPFVLGSIQGCSGGRLPSVASKLPRRLMAARRGFTMVILLYRDASKDN